MMRKGNLEVWGGYGLDFVQNMLVEEDKKPMDGWMDEEAVYCLQEL